MADNVVSNAGSGGATWAAPLVTFSGDSCNVTMVGVNIMSGSEGAWTMTQIVGGAGAVTAGVQRVTLASDDPGVALLTTIDADTGAMVTDLAAIEVLLGTIDADTSAIATDAAAIEVLITATNALLTTIDADTSKITACNTGAVVIASGTVTTVSTVTNLSQLGGQAISMGTGARDAGTQRVTIATDDSVPVTGTFWQSTQPVSIAGTVTVDLGSNNDVTVTGSVIAVLSATDNAVLDDIADKLGTIDNAISGAGFNITQLAGAAVPIGAGTEAAALLVTLATDSTGVVSIDDNGGAITVDGTVAVTGMTACNTGAVVLAAGSAEIGKLGAGTAAIGKLAANSGVDIGDVDVTSIAAGTNTIGGVIAQASSSVVYDGTTACTVKRFHVVTSTSGAAVIAAPSGTKKIRVLSLSAICLSATSYTWYLETGTTGTDTFGTAAGPITFDMDGTDGPSGIVLPWNPGGWFQTADADEALEVVLSAAQLILLCGNYIEVT